MTQSGSGTVIEFWGSFFFREFARSDSSAIMALDPTTVLVVCVRREGDGKPFDRALAKVPPAEVNLCSRFRLADDMGRETECRLAEIMYGPRHFGLVLDPSPDGAADIGPAPNGSALYKIMALAAATLDGQRFRLANSFFVPALLRRPLRL